jgi:hypothetical protein
MILYGLISRRVPLKDFFVVTDRNLFSFTLTAHIGYTAFCVLLSLVLGRFEPSPGTSRVWFRVFCFSIYSGLLFGADWVTYILEVMFPVQRHVLQLLPIFCPVFYLGLSLFEICWAKWRKS